MKQIFLQGNGSIDIIEVPTPTSQPGNVLVKTAYSLISAGTESAATTSSRGILGYYEKAMANTDKISQIRKLMISNGIRQTLKQINTKLTDYTPIGYSAAGIVIDADQNSDVKAGEQVACIGTGFANHAELISVPNNLVAKLPREVTLSQASFGALGCIAMQGIRRLQAQPGETIAVIGLGLIGQLTARILIAYGYPVIGIDIDAAKTAYLEAQLKIPALSSHDKNIVTKVHQLTENRGCDGVIITAGTSSSEPVNMAFDICRKRATVIMIGDAGMNLDREKMYRKEIDFRISCSYGPGRYDPHYELEGFDYPLPYVRWTQQRNLDAFLKLIATQKLTVDDLITKTFLVDDARQAYQFLKSPEDKKWGIILKYSTTDIDCKKTTTVLTRNKTTRPSTQTVTERVKLGLIGVGGYAKNIHIPNLLKLNSLFSLQACASRTGTTATTVAKKVGANYATSDYTQILNDPGIDAVVIATRHDSHAKIVCDALLAGKHVFVEKPMAVSIEDANTIVKLTHQTGKVVHVGMNRRFSPYIKPVKALFSTPEPKLLSCTVNINVDAAHWSFDNKQGGRFLGEAIHFLDLCNYLMGDYPLSMNTHHLGKNCSSNVNRLITLKYPDGSIGEIKYATVYANDLPKEHYQASVGQSTLIIDNFQRLMGYACKPHKLKRLSDPKGQLACIADFGHTIKDPNYCSSAATEIDGYLTTWMAIKSAQEGCISIEADACEIESNTVKADKPVPV